MTLTFAFAICASGLFLAALASYIGSMLRFVGRHDGPAEDHESQAVSPKNIR